MASMSRGALGSTAAMVVLAGTIIGNGRQALAQSRLPDPPVSSEQTPTLGKVDNFDKFVAAYQRSARPRLFVYTDIVSAQGNPGGDLGDLARLANRVEEFFRHPDVILVNVGGQAMITGRQVEELRRNDEFGAARIVGEAAKADVVLFIRLVEQAGRRDGSSYLGTLTLADLRQGTTLGRHSWEMMPDPADRGQYTSQRMGEYAKAIARKAAQLYIEAYPAAGTTASRPAATTTAITRDPGAPIGVETTAIPVPAIPVPENTLREEDDVGVAMRRFQIMLVGDYEDDTLSDFRDAMRSIPGVKRDSVIVRTEDRAASGSVATMELLYAGDAMDLRTQLRRAAASQLGMEATVLGSREGAIELRLGGLGMSARERALAGGSENARNSDERSLLAYRYDKAGSPTIAVMMNEATVEVEDAIFIDPNQPGQNGQALQQGDGVNIVIGDRVGVSGDGRHLWDPYSQMVSERDEIDRRRERRQDSAIDTMYFENKVVERLVQLGLRPRDISAAQIEMADELKGRQWKDRELASALGKKSGADIVLSGVGRLVRDRRTQEPQRITFTLRAYDVVDGTVIGAASASRDVASGDRTFNQVLDELSAETTGKLVAQMSDAWNRQARDPARAGAREDRTTTREQRRDREGNGGEARPSPRPEPAPVTAPEVNPQPGSTPPEQPK